MALILIVCYVIGQSESNNSIIVKDISTITKDAHVISHKRLWWTTLTILQAALCISLFKTSKKHSGSYRVALFIAFAIAFVFFLLFTYIFIISLRSLWL